jgi:PhnB protein
MITKRETVFSKDLENKRLIVVRAFDAPLERVWQAWTESEILDQWWAPKPYKAETKTMDFKEGGFWLYCMVGPEDYRAWCIENYKTIETRKRITNSVAFCDEQGNQNTDFPVMNWDKGFKATGNDTTVNIEIIFDKEADMETIIKMGFQEGFTAGLDNLDDYLSTK